MSESSPLALLRDRFGLDDRNLARTLETALERRIDSAELFLEYATQDSVALEEGIVKSGDDCRQELLAIQLLLVFEQVFRESGLPLWMRPFQVWNHPLLTLN